MYEQSRVKELVTTALLGTLLAILGTFKLPSIIPGTEFQLSAPFAICIAAYLGFKRYFQIGLLASMINLLIGTHTVLNVTVAMVFRIVAGGILAIFKVNYITLIISGPIGTISSRLILGGILHTSIIPLIISAIPGMIFTGIMSTICYSVMKKVFDYSQHRG